MLVGGDVQGSSSLEDVLLVGSIDAFRVLMNSLEEYRTREQVCESTTCVPTILVYKQYYVE